MDYEKKYKEALERAKKLHKDATTLQLEQDIKDYEYIFPELKKSDDERIRKALIKYFTLSDDNADYQCCGVHCKDIVAWLEKQEKQMPTDNIESSAFKEKLLELFQRFRYIKEGVPTNGDIIDYVDAHIQELIDTVQNNPWSKEDERNLEFVISKLRIIIDEKHFAPVIDWLKSLKDRYTWKPSDEQLNNILDVLSFDNCTPKRRELLESLYQDLKRLKQ